MTLTKERLLDAAVDVLMEPGQRFTSVEIARRAGIAQSALYNHFESIDACKVEACARIEQSFFSIAEMLLGELESLTGDPEADCARILGAALDDALSNPALYRLFGGEELDPMLRETVHRVRRNGIRKGEAAITQPGSVLAELHVDEASLVIRYLFSAAGAAVDAVLDGGDPAMVAANCSRFMVGGIDRVVTPPRDQPAR